MDSNIIKLKNNIYFISIAKNACSTLKYLAYNINNDTLYNDYNYENLHNYIRPWCCNYCWDLKKFIKPDNSITFAIYRDPVERFISAYINMKNGGMLYTYMLIKSYNGCNTFNDFLNYAKYEINMYGKNYYDYIDEHLRPQSFYYNYNDIDYLVKIEDLDNFLFNVLGNDIYNKYYKEKQNVCNIDKSIFYKEITDENIKDIKILYKDDYLLLEKYKDKLWNY